VLKHRPAINDNILTELVKPFLQNEQLVGFIEANDQDVRDPHPIRYELVRPQLSML
jgi:hypothetical protein